MKGKTRTIVSKRTVTDRICDDCGGSANFTCRGCGKDLCCWYNCKKKNKNDLDCAIKDDMYFGDMHESPEWFCHKCWFDIGAKYQNIIDKAKSDWIIECEKQTKKAEG